jgi:hypothetical protein
MKFFQILKNRAPIQTRQDVENERILFKLIKFIKQYSLTHNEEKNEVDTNSIDIFLNYLYILINVSNLDFDYIKMQYVENGLVSNKRLTLEDYQEYVKSNPNPQDNLDKLIQFIINNESNYSKSNVYANDRNNITVLLNYIRNIINTGLIIKDKETLLKEKQQTWSSVAGSVNGGNNKQYKEILGKRRRIYKIKGSRKEHVKYKGELIPVSDYKKLVKK